MGSLGGFWGNPPQKREGCGGMVVGVIGWGGYRGVALTRRSQRSPADPGAACVERVNTTYWTQRDLFIELMGRVLKYRVIVFLFRLHPGRRVDGRLGQCRRAQQDGKRLDTPTNPIAKFPTHKENAPPCKKMITTHVVVTPIIYWQLPRCTLRGREANSTRIRFSPTHPRELDVCPPALPRRSTEPPKNNNTSRDFIRS